MAKTTDQLAGKLGTKVTGRLRTGLLADEKSLDRRGMWRLGIWAGIAISAVTAAMIASQYATALRQDEATATAVARQSRQIESLAKESQADSRRLASAVDTLNGDRDRLFARVTVLEQGFEALNSAKARQSSAATPPVTPATPATASAEPAAPAQPPASPVTGAAPKSPLAAMALKAEPMAAATTLHPAAASPSPAAPEASPMAIAKSAIGAMVRSADAAKTAPNPATPPSSSSNPAAVEPPATTAATGTAALAQKSPTEKTAAEKPSTEAQQAAAAANPQAAVTAPPLVAAKSILAPPDPAAGKWVEPSKPSSDGAAAAPDVVGSIGAAGAAQGPATTVKRTEFAVDVGGASSVGGLRAMWLGLVKSNPALAKLVPIIVVKENSGGLGLQLRLVAGPLDDAAAAARICAGLAENKRSCEPTLYDGQRLALKAEEEPEVKSPDVKNAEARAPGPRLTMHRRYSYRRAAPGEDTVKKPEPSFSLLFSRH